jgi:hypothetical protein
MQKKLLGIANVDFDVTEQQLHQLFIDFKKACDSVMKEVLYNVRIEFGIPLKSSWAN